MPEKPEQRARRNIDQMLVGAGWAVQDRREANITAGRGVAIREFPLKPGNGFADYLLYVDGAAAGVSGLRQATVYPDKLIRVRLLERVPLLPAFLEIILNAGPSRTFLRSRVRTTAGQAGISGADIRAIPIAFPSVESQRRTVVEVDRRLSVADSNARCLGASLKRAERLRQAILKRAFEGRLVPQDPNDEPAETLLRRARANGKPAAGRKVAVEGK